MKYIISTLGCKVNQYETQAMETWLSEQGIEPAAPGERADLVLVNTCAVTAESERKSRQMIRRLRDENPGARIAVSGCYAQIAPEEMRKLGAEVVFGSGDRKRFVESALRVLKSGEPEEEIDDPFLRKEYEELPAGAPSGRTRAMLKIQDGCVNFCTYCIIPYTRGRLRSLPLEKAAEQAESLAGDGFKELVLTGIEVASYGVDLPGRPSLADVVAAVAEKSGSMRIRLGSLEPTVITDEFCRRLAALGKVCPHFHLSLQSGCDRTLRAMNRKYDTALFYEKTKLLRTAFPDCAITCDLITGFPGETETDHAETLKFIEKCGFSAMHIFPYSRRPGTPADLMPGQCTQAVKIRRAREAKEIALRMQEEYLDRQIGCRLPVLFETTEKDGRCYGHSDNYLLVSVAGDSFSGQMKRVRITGREGESLCGVID
ncbi:MAG: tRNA (N(6)-L-threonylcarbamoyladenosine(37)-C(2))-methylthiotransferase MtaB [Oscillospiraceae bacterium]|nr:tRNA (N(6)-L-threonylcarbamoyladenosine(37)-C(2))-methylthiotransferase MtaB [Oscillospiraceae bacterium]